MAEKKEYIDTNDAYETYGEDEKGAGLAADARKQSVALNIVENPLKVSHTSSMASILYQCGLLTCIFFSARQKRKHRQSERDSLWIIRDPSWEGTVTTRTSQLTTCA